MITTALRNALRGRGTETALLCHTGAGARAHLDGLPLTDSDAILDLDARVLGEPVKLQGVWERDLGPEAGLVAVVAATTTDLHRSLTAAAGLPRAVQVVVAILDTTGHQEPPLPASPGMGQWRDLQEARVRRVGRRGWLCELFFPNGVETPQVLDAIWSGTRGRRRGPAVAPLAALSGPEAALWRPGDTGAHGVEPAGPVPLRRVTPVGDLALRVGDDTPPGWTDAAVPVLDRRTTSTDAWERIAAPGGGASVRESADPVAEVAPIDELTVNPIGFTKHGDAHWGDLTAADGRAVIRQGKKDLVVVPPDGTITDVDLGRLRHLRGVRVDWSGHGGPTAAVRAVASLAAGGVPLVGGSVPAWAAGLGAPLIDLLLGTTEEDLADPLRREEYSVRLRRVALRTHGTRSRWRTLGARAGVPVPPAPTVSVILCTRRPEMVGFALAQIARQRGVDIEVVLTLHGFPATLPEVAAAIAGFEATGLPLVVREADADRIFGSVLNDAVARTSGDLVSKWDDDDWYGPDHLADLVLARTYSGAELLGVGQDFVYLQEVDLTLWREGRSESSSRFIAGGTILTDRAVLEETGGFRPVPRSIDTQLLIAVMRGGGRIYRGHGLGYVLRRTGGGHTWSEDMAFFLRNRIQQWFGWHPSALLEGEPEPFGRPVTEYTGGLR
ncbi:glycosyltransferase [Nocardiopsis lambiniae]|uniref:Glycosyltransferase family 2 protein n=1 Tax=Nocardiopsis lambiniae TaxID=3075539 RepID=A0ABU2M5A6_9ACTN|nr:glycosyltransferase family 2 protein [Nocardiopsis sp. DSM 44743]MDT0327506.1 glycosyltransferase family 2 protein [Nocardiopsis sp. DSM 44743]